ncbi:MAG: AAA family ATPase [Puniceicoccales bacterium]|jgi:general secretion pathway protein A|nr:AAA family ATPase [Puniceicoccales bacterium]
MYLKFFELKEKPFRIGTDASYLYMGDQYQTALSLLQYGVAGRDGFTVITGEVGCGKTTICQALLAKMKALKDVTILLDNPPDTEHEMLIEICMKLQASRVGESVIESREIIKQILSKELKKGRHAVLLIDEAQNLSFDMLEKVRLLSNLEPSDGSDKLLHIVLLGQPELKKKLKANCMRQLRQRILVYYDLRPLKNFEVDWYIKHRLERAGSKGFPIFTFWAKRKLFFESKGIPRIINNLCDKAMLSAFVNSSKVITYKDVANAVKDVKQLK